MTSTFLPGFERSFRAHAERPALICGGREWTYAELWSAVERAAGAVVRSARRKGAVVVLAGDPALEIVAVLGAYRAARIAVPLSPGAPAAPLADSIDAVDAALILTDREGAAGLPPESSGRPRLRVEEALRESPAPLPDFPGPEAPAYVHFTSGSTGRPKGVLHSHASLLACAEAYLAHAPCGPEDRHVLLSSCAFAQSNGVIYPALLTGGCVAPFDLESRGLAALRDFLAGERITVYQSVPSVFRALARSLPAGDSLSGLRLVKLGADTITAEDARLFERVVPPPGRLRIGYGSTEVSPATFSYVERGARHEDPLPVGIPVPGVELYLLDDAGRPLPDSGAAGEAAIAAEALAEGYWNDPGLTAERFVPAPRGSRHGRMYRTGDVLERLPDGRFVHRGRRTGFVKVRGVRVELTHVEAVLRSLPGVAEAACDARPGPDGERRLIGYVVPRGNSVPSARALRAAAGDRLPEPMVPTSFVVLAELPLNANRKVDRSALPDPPAPEAGPVPAPVTDEEARMLEIWRAVFETESLGPDDDFFDLGGHSLQAAILFSEIERLWGRPFSPSLLLEAPTARQLADAVGRAGAREEKSASLLCLREGGSRPVFCVPGSNGPGFTLRLLAELLPAGVPVHALHLPLSAGSAGPPSIEGWAEMFLPKLRERQEHGPYRLVGHSSGGTVCWEIARRLRAAGEEVEWLAHLDTHSPVYPRRVGAPVRWAQKWRDFLGRPGRDRAATVRRTLRRGLRRFGGATPRTEAPAAPSLVPPGDAFARAIRAYSHPPLDCPVILFRATRKPRWIGFSFADRGNGWKPFARGPFHVVAVEGDHNTLLGDPGVRTIAAELSRRLSAS